MTQSSDPHAWLRCADWPAVLRDPAALEPGIRSHLEQENRRTETELRSVATLKDDLARELRARVPGRDADVPVPDGAYAYYQRFEDGGEYPILCRVPADDTTEEVLLDGNREAAQVSFFRIGGARHSPDHGMLAYAADRKGSEKYEVRFLALPSRVELADRLPETQGDLAWSLDSRQLFYTVLDDQHRPWQVRRHRLGDSPESDVTVFTSPSPQVFVSVSRTESGRFIRIDCHEHADSSETYLIDASQPASEPVPVWPRREGVRYTASDQGDQLLILTNDDGAEDFKVVQVPMNGDRTEAHEVVPHRAGVYLLDMQVFADWLVRLERVAGLPRIVVRNLRDDVEYTIDAGGEEAFNLQLVPGMEYGGRVVRYVYSSLTTPSRTFDFDLRERTSVLRKEQQIPGGHDADQYVAKRLTARSDDGAEVPISLVHRRDLVLDGRTPLLLYGYGAYGHATPASFAHTRFSLLDRGFVYAIAHVRGGTELGYGWYLDGKLEHKENSFTDFVAAGRVLVQEGYTARGRIIAHGGSAGGLLVGASLNRESKLFGGVIAEVPFVDVLNTMLDATLPLTPPEWSEWGDPIRDEAARVRIGSYCPYSNVSERRYPAVLATAGLTDPRVGYWEPAKWIAKLREHTTSAAPVLLWTNLEAGHGGSAGRFARLDEVALVYAFALMTADT